MKAITILMRCRSADADKRRIRQRIQQRREVAESVTPTLGGGGGGSGASTHDKMLTYVASVDDLERALYQREQERVAEAAAACALLDALPAAESAVLHKYYLMGVKTATIAQALGYAESTVRNLKRVGEELLDDLPERTVHAALPSWYIQGEAAPGQPYSSQH